MSLGKTDTVFGLLHQNGVILLCKLIFVFLICLSLCVFFPRLGICAKCIGAALNGAVLDIDQIRKLWHQLTQQCQSVSILLLFFVGKVGIFAHLLQFCDVLIGNICCRHGRGDGAIIGGLGLVHRFPHIPCCLRQLLHRGNGIIRKCRCQRRNYSDRASHSCGNCEDRSQRGGRNGCEGRCCCSRQFDDDGISSKRGCYKTNGTCERRDRIDQGRILLDKLGKAVEHFRPQLIRFSECRCIGIADRHFEIVVGVLHHGQAALYGGVALIGLVGEGGILLPCGIGGVHRAGHLVCGKTQGFEHIALPDAGQTQVFQYEDGALALLVQLAEPADEGSQGAHGVVLPRRRKFFGGHTRDTGELREVVPALCNGLFNGVERLGHGGTARLGFDADRGHRRRQSHDLRLGQSGQLARRRQARTHRHDLGFRRGEVVAKVNDDRAEPSVIVRCHAGNVGEARKGGCCLVSCHVGGSAEHGHDLGEVQQGVLLDAELSRGFGYRRDLLCGGGDLRG